MSLHISKAENAIVIFLDKKFDFESVNDFRKAYTDNAASEYMVDFRNTEYMDSSGLGMLLNMKRHFEDNNARILLINCRPQIKKILMISRFDKKFIIK